MRIAPRPWLGVLALVAYLSIIAVIQGTSGIPYDDLAGSTENVWRSGVLSIALASLVMAGFATWWGWWRPALIERPTTTRRWLIIAPVLVLVLAVINLAVTDWDNVGADFVIAGIVLGVLVGFGEELATRGLLLTALRDRLREVLVWIFTCVGFGLIHGLNILLGAAPGPTLFQIFNAGLLGSVFYITRRVTGSLFWAMALHGLWDFSLFTLGVSKTENPLSLLSIVIGLVAAVLGYFATKDVPSRSEPRTTSGTGASTAPAPTPPAAA